MWKDDCVIDDIELDASSLEVPRLHAKYTELLSEKKLEVVRYERKMKELNKDKWLWYGCKMSREQIEEKNWDYDPFDGLTVLKSDYDKFTGSDQDIQDLKNFKNNVTKALWGIYTVVLGIIAKLIFWK